MTAKNIFEHSQLDTRSNPNLLINGDFSVWQRGTSLGSAGYTVDRWRGIDGNCNARIGTPNNNHSKSIASTYKQDSGVTTRYPMLRQTIEDGSYKVQNGDLVFSVLIGAGSVDSSNAIAISHVTVDVIACNESNGGTTQTIVSNASPEALFPLTVQTWNKVVLRIPQTTITDISATPNIRISINAADGGTNGVTDQYKGFSASGAKLERGSVATPFIPDDPATNLNKCHRYYWLMGGVSGSGAKQYGVPVSHTTTTRQFYIPYPTTMRATPTVSAVTVGGDPAATIQGVTHCRLQVSNVAASSSSYLSAFSADAEL